MSETKKNLFEKIQNVRVALQAACIKKSGKMGGRDSKLYLELADFINPLNAFMLKERMTAIVNFTPEVATLTAYDFDSDQTFTVSSPMREAKVQGCNDMQNLGAVETYQRRYLYMAMFDIAEADLFDGGKGDGSEGQEEVVYASQEQLQAAEAAGIDLPRLANYCKRGSVSELTADDVEKAIAVKKRAAERKAAAQEGGNE